jgi:hypothetical protein
MAMRPFVITLDCRHGPDQSGSTSCLQSSGVAPSIQLHFGIARSNALPVEFGTHQQCGSN